MPAISATSACPTYPTCFDDGTFTFGGIVFRAPTGSSLTFPDIVTLSTSYFIQTGDCGGGAPRLSVFFGTGTVADPFKAVFVYIGPTPSFTGCITGSWQNTGNVVGTTDHRVDTSQVGGTFYDTWADALSLVGSTHVTFITVDVDGGWAVTGGIQTVLFDSITINSFVWQ